MLSAFGDEERMQRAKEMGVTQYFVRPIDFQALKARIESDLKIKFNHNRN